MIKKNNRWLFNLTGGLFLLLVGLALGFWMNKRIIRVEEVVINKREIIDEESVVTKVVEKATLSVVTVSINKNVVDDSGDLLRELLGFSIANREEIKNVEKDIGTGFIISSDGLIVTNKHVVADREAGYRVVVGNEIVEVENIYRDPINDLAILKINRKDLSAVELGDSDRLKVGQTVIAIGTALGEFRSTVTKGVISGLGRGIIARGGASFSERLDDVIQVDAAINPGNSGGPLFDSSGRVIGVNVAVSQNGQNIGFALPINLVKMSVDNFRRTGEFDRPYLGISYKMISNQIAKINKITVGAYIEAVFEGSPADKAGIKRGDIIVEIDGKEIKEDDNLLIAEVVNKRKIGDVLKVKYFRKGKEVEIEIKLEKKQ